MSKPVEEIVVTLEVCDPGGFDKEVYRKRFIDLLGPGVAFAMDPAPRFNEKDGFWFVTARARKPAPA